MPETPRGNRSRRTVLLTAVAGLLPGAASAQANWPSKPIRIVVPFATGG